MGVLHTCSYPHCHPRDNSPNKNVSNDRDHLREAQVLAHSDTESAESRFRTWATKYVQGAKYMNVGSGPQIRQLFYSGAVNQKPTKKDEYLEMERAFKVAPFHLSPTQRSIFAQPGQQQSLDFLQSQSKASNVLRPSRLAHT